VLPLSHPGVTVTTGFRWLCGDGAKMGPMVHNSVNIFIYVLFSVASFLGEVGLWGGSMAIRREDFEALDVVSVWGRSAVDDMSLSRAVVRSGKEAVMVPACITRSNDLLQTVRAGIGWFERQIMFLKAYYRRLWLCLAAPVALLVLVFTFWLPWALLGSISQRRTFWGLGGAAPLVWFGGEAVVVLLYPLLGTIPHLGRFFVLQPFLRTTHLVSYLRTMFTNVITWSGVKYYLDRHGTVVKVERMAT
jgi:hypothetical protein